ncbi:MAG: LacI family transcriptional regulator, partial [Bifidobacteriaceae bacterium]|nr:LacI family transcriptional regulator [Bifidobacteriaceae bacterium]
MSQDPSARRAATMVDVAAAAGISRGTVSRYVNGRGYVSPHARQKIEQAVAEVGFVPNVAARRLAGAAARHIALVVHEDVARFAQDANLGAMMVGANRRLNQLDYQLVVLIAGDQPAIERLQQTIRGGLIDAAMLASARLNDPIFGLLQAAGLPVAVVGRHPELPAAAAVDVDNRGGAREIVTRLLATGRRQVGLIAGPADAQSALDREEGFRDATGTA